MTMCKFLVTGFIYISTLWAATARDLPTDSNGSIDFNKMVETKAFDGVTKNMDAWYASMEDVLNDLESRNFPDGSLKGSLKHLQRLRWDDESLKSGGALGLWIAQAGVGGMGVEIHLPTNRQAKENVLHESSGLDALTEGQVKTLVKNDTIMKLASEVVRSQMNLLFLKDLYNRIHSKKPELIGEGDQEILREYTQAFLDARGKLHQAVFKFTRS